MPRTVHLLQWIAPVLLLTAPAAAQAPLPAEPLFACVRFDRDGDEGGSCAS